MDSKNFDGLSGLRGVFALVVCAAHSWQAIQAPVFGFNDPIALFWGVAARLAVIGFFVLSGWVIAYSVVRHSQGHRFDSKKYFVNRVIRIIPPLAVSVLLVVLLQLLWDALRQPLPQLPIGNTFARPDFSYDLLSAFQSLITLGLFGDLTGGINGPLWSLVFEMQLYCLVGLAAMLVKQEQRPVVLILLTLIFGWFSGASLSSVNFICYTSFIAGFLAFCYLRNFHVEWVAKTAWPSFVLALYLYVFIDPTAISRLDHGLAAALQIGFAFGISLSIAKYKSHPLLAKWSRWGEISYTLYILHFPIFLVISFILYTRFVPTMTNLWLWWGGCVGLVVFISYPIGRIFEQPNAQKAWIFRRLATFTPGKT
jgi:peptidoglycan/LPS O-acetylase OafA/YrhL